MKNIKKTKGALVLISSPSGGGKNSVIKILLERFENTASFVTTTTRKKRYGEKHEKDYFFISRKEFETKITNDEFVEYNEYAGNLYGTEKTKFDEFLYSYDIVFSQADVHGKHSLDELAISHLSIFLMPENMDILERRIIARGSISEDKIKERMKIAKEELKASESYDFRIVNAEGKLEETVEKIVEIIQKYINNRL